MKRRTLALILAAALTVTSVEGTVVMASAAEFTSEAAEETEAEVCVFNADLYDHTEKVYKKCTWAFRKQYFPEKEPFAATDENVRNNIFRMFNGWPWDKLYQREYVRRLGIKYQNLRTTMICSLFLLRLPVLPEFLQ